MQALYLMNSKFMAEAIERESSSPGHALPTPQVPTTRRIEELFLITLSRKPRPRRSERLRKYVDNGGPTGGTRKALADVFWALLNSRRIHLEPLSPNCGRCGFSRMNRV